MSTVDLFLGIEAAQKILSEKRVECVYLYPVWLKLQHAADYLNLEVKSVFADGGAE